MRRRMTLEDIDAAIARWEARLFRAASALQKLRGQRKRAVRPVSSCHCAAEPAPHAPHRAAPLREPPSILDASKLNAPEVILSHDLDIPQALRRPLPNAADEKAKAEIIAAQAEQKKRKTAGRIAKMKAAQSGETRRMPLSGRAALEAIKKAPASGA